MKQLVEKNFWPEVRNHKYAFSSSDSLKIAFSFVGVVLIARPEFLFGSHQVVPVEGIDLPPAEKGTNAERLVAVGYVISIHEKRNSRVVRVALLGVLGATGACMSYITTTVHNTDQVC